MNNNSGIKKHLLDLEPNTLNKELSTDEMVEMYCTMASIRLMEQKIQVFYEQGKIRGFCHLSIGQEHIYAILKSIIQANRDKVIGSYRCHALAFATGSSISDIVAENLGLQSGCSKGKGGSMHLYNDRFYGGHGIVGAQVPLGTGIAFAIKYKALQTGSQRINLNGVVTGEVCFVFYGDGASNQGQVYEAFNMALIYKLPVVFVCENNGYGMFTPVSSVSPDDNFYMRGYKIPGLRVEKDCALSALYGAFEYARDYARSRGPIILQIDTDRICGHSTLDVEQKYKKNKKETDVMAEIESAIKAALGEDELANLKAKIEGNLNSEI
ncbi:pyruvate dehydrogenase E1 component alpha subunit [Enteropsectra breve]|nr:pyruvate dehydrogenase E1 component alpha subunit [Enteropsectra breve]